MLDIKFIRANPELVRNAIRNKNEKADLDALLEADELRRKLQFDFDQLKARQNQVSQTIAQKKKAKEDATDLLQEMSAVADEIKTLNTALNDANARLENLLLQVPNVPHPSVPVGSDESANKIVKEWGSKPCFDFEPLDHLEIAERNRLLDLTRGAKLSGSGFPVYTDRGAALERALINFMLNFHIQEHGYTEGPSRFW